MTKTIKLKPCPFCGSTNVVVIDAGPAKSYGDITIRDFAVNCNKCGASTMKWFETEQKAVTAWNMRAGEKDETD